MHVALSLSVILMARSIDADCRYYADSNTGLAFPADVCMWVSSVDHANTSVLYHCARDGVELQSWDNAHCSGSPDQKQNTDPSAQYNCGSGTSPDECNTATVKGSCGSTWSTLQTTIILGECVNLENASYIAQCGNLWKYQAPDCQGAAVSNNDALFADSGCDLVWDCLDSDSDSDNGSRSTFSAVAMVAVVVAVCVLCAIIGACVCKKQCNAKQAAEIKWYSAGNKDANKNNYKAPLLVANVNAEDMQPVDVETDIEVMPSAPTMPSINEFEMAEHLPAGWSKAITEDGKVYYQNASTHETQWEKPTASVNRMPTTGLEGGGNVTAF